MALEASRERHRGARRAIQAGTYVGASAIYHAAPDSFECVTDAWLASLDERGVITAKNIESALGCAKDAWRGRKFTSIKRSEVVALLDRVALERGPTAADFLFGRLSSLTKWFASRNDDYQSPLYGVNLRRTSNKERARERVLSDAELRSLWLTAERTGTFGAFVRICLLTGQRRTKTADMKWDDLDGGIWHMRKERREKGVGGDLRLPPSALKILAALPRFVSSDFVFASSRTGKALKGYSDLKAKFDAEAKIASWHLHDLRRTARSLMSRAGVPPHIAERVLGHAIAGVEGVYDRHAYADEKAAALELLAELIDKIVHGSVESTRAA